jgi:hypothetical protein
MKQLILKGNDLIQQLNVSLHTNTIKTKEENQISEINIRACKFNHFLIFSFH